MRVGKGGEVVKVLVVTLAIILVAGAVWASEVPLMADAGIHVMLGRNQPAEHVRDIGASIGYRPTYVNELGLEQYSRLLFLLSGNYGSGTGDMKILARFGSWWGVDWLAGPGLMAIEEAGTYSLGPIGEFRIEAYSGNNPIQISMGAGHVWRNATEDNPNPNPVPLWVKFGIRTQ